MSILTSDCPHCRAKMMTFDVIGATVPVQGFETRPFVVVAATCRECGLPITQRYWAAHTNDVRKLTGMMEHLIASQGAMSVSWLFLGDTWPHPEPATTPADLPPEVERAFVQAETNFAAAGCEEAAAMMYRRALEVGLKLAYPTMSGSLAARIKKLVIDHHLPAPIGEWLDQVRLIGNDGAHEIDGVTRDDLAAERGFVDTALRYIFTLPAQIASRRGLPAQVA